MPRRLLCRIITCGCNCMHNVNWIAAYTAIERAVDIAKTTQWMYTCILLAYASINSFTDRFPWQKGWTVDNDCVAYWSSVSVSKSLPSSVVHMNLFPMKFFGATQRSYYSSYSLCCRIYIVDFWVVPSETILSLTRQQMMFMILDEQHKIQFYSLLLSIDTINVNIFLNK
jgi:hypothetical protein